MMSAAAHLRTLGNYQHTVISLLEPNPDAVAIAKSAGMNVVHTQSRAEIDEILSESDIIQIEWWNEPMLDDFLRQPLPPARLVSWMHIAGNCDPQFVTPSIVEFSDIALASSPRCANCPAIETLDRDTRSRKVRMIYDCAEFDRVRDVKPIEHKNFNVGYIGTVNPVKMHADYVSMSASISIPDVKFVVCGGDQQALYMRQAAAVGATERFSFKGYVENIAAEIAIFDVYGYPLCDDTFASAELNLQEVMYVGIPPVVFPHGGIGELVINDFTGFIVHTAKEYKEAIEFLYHHPEERFRLGKNARTYAQQIFGAENAAKKFHSLYSEVINLDKRQREWRSFPIATSKEFNPTTIPTGCRHFLESLGEVEKIDLFIASIQATSPEEALETDKAIANLSPLMKLVGIQTYSGYYEDDPWLLYWSALAHFGNGNLEAAIVTFSVANNKGFPDWRPIWFVCLSLQMLGKTVELDQVLNTLLGVVPNFQPALEMQRRIHN